MGTTRRDGRMAAMALVLSAAAPEAMARESQMTFSIPVQARETALLALGREAGLSLGFAPGARCDGVAGLNGRMSLDAALSRLLEGSACVAARPDARTIVIRHRPSAAKSVQSAPPARAPSPTQLDEIVVTADKTERLLSSAPYGLTAVSGQDLQRRGVADVRDLSLIAAGVTVTNLGPGRDKVLLRGLSDGPLTGHTQSTVGLYLGELRLTYNAPDPNLPLIDVARVEVLRGPQGSLYGAGSIGGIVKVTPNAPDPGQAWARVSASLSATAHSAASGMVQAVANLPVSDGGSALRVAVWSERDGGHLDNPGLGLRNTDRTRRQGVRLSGLWQISDTLALDLMLIDQTISTRDAHYVDSTLGRRVRSALILEPHDNDFLAAAFTARWSPEWGRLTFSFGALDHDVGTTSDATRAPAVLVAPGARGRSFNDENEIRSLVSEVQVSSVGAGKLHWTLGAFASRGDQRINAELEPTMPVAGYVEARRDHLSEGAVFGEFTYDLTRTVSLTVGGRAFGSSLRTVSTVSVGAPSVVFRGRTRDTGIAPKVLLAYRPAAGLTLYAQASEGYRTGGFNTGGHIGQSFGARLGDPQPLRRYGGDELWNYEAGVRWTSPDLGLALRAAAFQADWQDIQTDLILPSGLGFTGNLGNGRSRGVEVEGAWTHGALSVGGNLVRKDPELRRGASGLPARKETGLPGVPRLSFAANIAYGVELPQDRRLDLTLSYAWVGRSRLALDPSAVASMGGYGDLRLAATLRSGPADLGLFMDNALNRHGDTLAFGNPFTFRTTQQATPQRPRTVGLRATRSF